MTEARFIVASDALDSWRDDVLSGKPPTLWSCGAGELSRIEVGPGLVMLIGGAPGAGKTAFTMQLVFDALRTTPTLRALLCNVEMSPGILLDRQLARMSGVALTEIRYRRLGAAHADRIDQAMNTLDAVADRLCFVRPPFDLGNVAAVADEFGATLLVLDYIQRIRPPGEHDGHRTEVNKTMDFLRQFADAGCGIIVVSAVGRTKDVQGRSSYSGAGLNLASFRESSELEFGADDAFILAPHQDDPTAPIVKLKHLKSRHGEARDLWLTFDRPRQRFTPTDPPEDRGDGKRRRGSSASVDAAGQGRIRAKLAELWGRTAPAAEEADGGDDE